MRKLILLSLIVIFLNGCAIWALYEMGKNSGGYGLNEDGGCSEGCVKKYFEGDEGEEDMAYCECKLGE